MGFGRWAVVVACCVATAGCGDDDDDRAQETQPQGEPLPDPPQVRSQQGVLDVTLTAGPAPVTVAGKTFVSNVYNGVYIPPTLRVRPGDRVKLQLVDHTGPADVQLDAAQMTNLHFHGMDIPPTPNADDIFLHVPSGQSHAYDWVVPLDHPRGLHWYHPHPHGESEPQVLSGMSGLLLVEGLIDDFYPELRGIRERQMLLKDVELPGAKASAPKTKTINGLAFATIDMRPGELQLWELGNVGADAYFDMQLEGHDLWVLARDGNPLPAPLKVGDVFLPPASRASVVVVAGAPGSYAWRSLEIDTGPQGDPNPEVVLGSVEVAGDPVDSTARVARLSRPATNLNLVHPTQDEIRRLPITRTREITFSETADGDTFFINGRQFDPNRVDTTVHLGDVEEWTVRNISGEVHAFHIHQTEFLVTSENNQNPDTPMGLRDTINVAPEQDGVPGEVKVVIPFTDPAIVGKFVYHCHIFEHEDGGMMATIVVTE